MSRPFSSTDVFRAVADPTRRRIMDLLRRRDMAVSEIAQSFRVSMPTLSFHLRVLRQSGLAIARRRGRHLMYSANRRALRPLVAWLEGDRSTLASAAERGTAV